MDRLMDSLHKFFRNLRNTKRADFKFCELSYSSKKKKKNNNNPESQTLTERRTSQLNKQ